MNSDRLSLAYLVSSALGIAIAVYLANDYLTQSFNGCYINQKFSCFGVFLSGHTSIAGVPFYVLGLVWFPIVFLLGIFLSRAGRAPLKAEILLPILMIGNIFTIYLWYLELEVIGVICPLCVALYIVNYALTILALKSLF